MSSLVLPVGLLIINYEQKFHHKYEIVRNFKLQVVVLKLTQLVKLSYPIWKNLY